MARSKDFDEDETLDKAVQLFWYKGYNATSAQDLVDGLGINRSSLYNTFGDKKQLFLKSLARYREQTTGAMLTFIAASTDAEQTLRGILEFAAQESVTDVLPRGCFMVNSAVEVAPHDADMLQAVSDNRKAVEDALCTLAAQGQASGQFSGAQRPQSIARFIYNTISGIRVAGRSGTSAETFEDIIQVTLRALR
jgi:TetR/AcrR family transcriptional repressor of nem operon